MEETCELPRYDESEQHAGPEGDAGDQRGRRMRGGPVGNAGGLIAREALVELRGGEDAAEDKREQCAERGEDGHGDDQGEQAGQEAHQLDQDAAHRFSQGDFYLLPHGRSPSRLLKA